MVNYISALVAIVLMFIGGALSFQTYQGNPSAGIALGVASLITSLTVSSAIKLAAQWEKGVVFRLGKFRSIEGPGIFLIIPVVDQVRIVDTRVLAFDIPRQQAITKDNVPVLINGVIFYKVIRADDAIIRVQDYQYAISQYAQTSLRDVIGQMTLDQLLTEREAIGKAIEANVVRDTERWGLEVTGIRIQDLDMPEELKKMMSRQASAEREKRATITKAEGDREAAENLAAAARTMAVSPGAMQLRTLQTLDALGPSASNTVVLALPVDVVQAATSLKEWLEEGKTAEHNTSLDGVPVKELPAGPSDGQVVNSTRSTRERSLLADAPSG